MKMQDRKWLEEKLRSAQPSRIYVLERTRTEAAKQYRARALEVVKLNLNENFFIPRQVVTELLEEVANECDLRTYPEDEEAELKEDLAGYMNVPSQCVTVANGSDELIAQIVHLFSNSSDRVLSIAPTFSMYRHAAEMAGREYAETPLRDDFSIDTDGILRLSREGARLLFLCSPNNPTANQFRLDEIHHLAEEFPGLLIVDEAYVEFGEYSIRPLLGRFENMIILGTFSKAFGLAGLRLGYAVASSDIAETISKTQLPYPVSSVALRMGSKMLAKADMMRKAVQELKRERERLIMNLNRVSGVQAFPSRTNFVLFRTDLSSRRVHERLLSRGIIVKNLGDVLHHSNCLRTTVGLPEMNMRLLSALEEVLGEEDE